VADSGNSPGSVTIASQPLSSEEVRNMVTKTPYNSSIY
jgi:hypothetical protein